MRIYKQRNKKIYCLSGVYPNDIRAELINNYNNNEDNNADLAVTQTISKAII